jgi:hypothetical protein
LSLSESWGFLHSGQDEFQRWASAVLQGIFSAKSVIGGQWQ